MAVPDKAKARRTLALVALVCAAPVVTSYAAYYWFTPTAKTNYGELLDPRPAPEMVGEQLDGGPFRLSMYRGKWVLLIAESGGCDDACRNKLYATRQARTMQGRERERIVRVWLQPTGAPLLQDELLAQHPGLIAARVAPAQWAALSESVSATRSVFLLDPLGNVVLRYPADPDIRRLSKDLERLLRASRIG